MDGNLVQKMNIMYTRVPSSINTDGVINVVFEHLKNDYPGLKKSAVFSNAQVFRGDEGFFVVTDRLGVFNVTPQGKILECDDMPVNFEENSSNQEI